MRRGQHDRFGLREHAARQVGRDQGPASLPWSSSRDPGQAGLPRGERGHEGGARHAARRTVLRRAGGTHRLDGQSRSVLRKASLVSKPEREVTPERAHTQPGGYGAVWEAVMMLYHFSDRDDIKEFLPRPPTRHQESEPLVYEIGRASCRERV